MPVERILGPTGPSQVLPFFDDVFAVVSSTMLRTYKLFAHSDEEEASTMAATLCDVAKPDGAVVSCSSSNAAILLCTPHAFFLYDVGCNGVLTSRTSQTTDCSIVHCHLFRTGNAFLVGTLSADGVLSAYTVSDDGAVISSQTQSIAGVFEGRVSSFRFSNRGVLAVSSTEAGYFAFEKGPGSCDLQFMGKSSVSAGQTIARIIHSSASANASSSFFLYTVSTRGTQPHIYTVSPDATLTQHPLIERLLELLSQQNDTYPMGFADGCVFVSVLRSDEVTLLLCINLACGSYSMYALYNSVSCPTLSSPCFYASWGGLMYSCDNGFALLFPLTTPHYAASTTLLEKPEPGEVNDSQRIESSFRTPAQQSDEFISDVRKCLADHSFGFTCSAFSPPDTTSERDPVLTRRIASKAVMVCLAVETDIRFILSQPSFYSVFEARDVSHRHVMASRQTMNFLFDSPSLSAMRVPYTYEHQVQIVAGTQTGKVSAKVSYSICDFSRGTSFIVVKGSMVPIDLDSGGKGDVPDRGKEPWRSNISFIEEVYFHYTKHGRATADTGSNVRSFLIITIFEAYLVQLNDSGRCVRQARILSSKQSLYNDALLDTFVAVTGTVPSSSATPPAAPSTASPGPETYNVGNILIRFELDGTEAIKMVCHPVLPTVVGEARTKSVVFKRQDAFLKTPAMLYCRVGYGSIICFVDTKNILFIFPSMEDPSSFLTIDLAAYAHGSTLCLRNFSKYGPLLLLLASNGSLIVVDTRFVRTGVAITHYIRCPTELSGVEHAPELFLLRPSFETACMYKAAVFPSTASDASLCSESLEFLSDVLNEASPVLYADYSLYVLQLPRSSAGRCSGVHRHSKADAQPSAPTVADDSSTMATLCLQDCEFAQTSICESGCLMYPGSVNSSDSRVRVALCYSMSQVPVSRVLSVTLVQKPLHSVKAQPPQLMISISDPTKPVTGASSNLNRYFFNLSFNDILPFQSDSVKFQISDDIGEHIRSVQSINGRAVSVISWDRSLLTTYHLCPRLAHTYHSRFKKDAQWLEDGTRLLLNACNMRRRINRVTKFESRTGRMFSSPPGEESPRMSPVLSGGTPGLDHVNVFSYFLCGGSKAFSPVFLRLILGEELYKASRDPLEKDHSAAVEGCPVLYVAVCYSKAHRRLFVADLYIDFLRVPESCLSPDLKPYFKHIDDLESKGYYDDNPEEKEANDSANLIYTMAFDAANCSLEFEESIVFSHGSESSPFLFFYTASGAVLIYRLTEYAYPSGLLDSSFAMSHSNIAAVLNPQGKYRLHEVTFALAYYKTFDLLACARSRLNQDIAIQHYCACDTSAGPAVYFAARLDRDTLVLCMATIMAQDYPCQFILDSYTLLASTDDARGMAPLGGAMVCVWTSHQVFLLHSRTLHILNLFQATRTVVGVSCSPSEGAVYVCDNLGCITCLTSIQ